MCSFLTNREQRVVFNGQSSSTSTVSFGVPQGSVLGPLFFLLYTADIQYIAEEFSLGVHCYADDGQLYFYEKASALPSVLSKVTTCITEIDRWMNSNRLKLNSDKTQFIWLGSRHELLKVSIDSIDLGSCVVKFQGFFKQSRRCRDRRSAFHERPCSKGVQDMLLPPSPASINQGLTVGWFLFSSCSGFYIQQTRLLQQSPDWNRQVTSEQAAVNPSSSRSPRDEKRKVRINLEWHPWQAPLASRPAEDQVQDWCPGLQVPPWNSPAIPIGNAQRSCRHCWPTIPPICCAWGPRCSTFQDGQIRLPNVRCFGSHFLELVDEWTQKFQFNWACF